MGKKSRQRTTKERTRTDEQRAADDAALVASGEALATLPEIGALLGVSVNVLRGVFQRKGAAMVRYLSSSRPVQHCVADARAAVEAARPEIDARRRRAEEIDRSQRAQGEATRAAKAAAKQPEFSAPVKAKPVSARAVVPVTRPRSAGPEVVMVRRPGRPG